MKKYQRPLEELGRDELIAEARTLMTNKILDKKIGSELVSLKDTSYFLDLTAQTIKVYYAFAEDERNKRFDFPPLPCYYKDKPRTAPNLWLRSEIFMIKDFSRWVARCKKLNIYMGLRKYYSRV